MEGTVCLRSVRRFLTPGWIGGVSFALAVVLAIGARCYLRKPKPAAREPARDAAIIEMTQLDAALPDPAVDAAGPDATLIDAAVADAAVPIDAAIVVEPARPPEPQPPPRRPPPRRSDAFTLETCSRNPTTDCVLLACSKQNEPKARAWFGVVPAKQRTNVIAQCLIDGIDLAPKPN